MAENGVKICCLYNFDNTSRLVSVIVASVKWQRILTWRTTTSAL